MSDETAEASGDAPFARDFGYLDKFLAGVTAHAAGVPGSRGDRLRELLSGEIERFTEIRSLLAGAEPRVRPTERNSERPAERNSDVAPPTRPIDVVSSSATSVPGRSLTVGSLLGDRRRVERDS